MVFSISFRFKDFFGLRDFIHMIHYLRREKFSSITPQLVMAALERNFNGCVDFSKVCKEFLRPVSVVVSTGKIPSYTELHGCAWSWSALDTLL